MKKRALIICIVVILIFIILSCILYVPSLFQEGNPLPILQSIIRLQLSNEKIIAISNNPERYITKTECGDDALISLMKSKGWIFKDQLGSGFIFENQGNSLTVVCRQYSKHFTVWTVPHLDEKEKAIKVIQEYFKAFEEVDYKTMSTLSTDRHNKNLIHTGDVWGMKWAKAKKIELISDPKFLRIENVESTLVFGVSVDMETVKTSAQYPSTQTFFYVVLVKGEDGIWRVDGYTTG